MRRLSDAELRFLIDFAVKQLEPALIRQLADKNPTSKRHAQTIVTDRLLARFDGHEVLAPEAVKAH